MTYTITIYDADPQDVGGCAWPARQSQARSLEAALRAALALARREGRASGEYRPGDVLHVAVRAEDGSVRCGAVTLDARGAPARWAPKPSDA